MPKRWKGFELVAQPKNETSEDQRQMLNYFADIRKPRSKEGVKARPVTHHHRKSKPTSNHKTANPSLENSPMHGKNGNLGQAFKISFLEEPMLMDGEQ